MKRLLASSVVGMMLVVFFSMTALAQTSPQVTILNRANKSVTTLTDGDLVHFQMKVPVAAKKPITYSFYLDKAANLLASCRIPRGEYSCITDPVGTLGWYWEENKVMPTRRIDVVNAGLARWLPAATQDISVKPRPVVLVHGFGSDYTAWINYLSPSGYLALAGLKGFAIGDGQVEGTMETGNILDPTARTHTIAQNAAILGKYIANVKALTGAEEVDLVVHSMGGLISRYYIDRLMKGRDVAQLIMLGTPNGGSNCTIMLGSLGFYEPAGIELREDYIRHVFNPQILQQRGIPFYNFAGTLIKDKLLSPCSAVPNDLVVSLDSASSAPVHLEQLPYIHTDLNKVEAVFRQNVLPLLQKSLTDFANQGTQVAPHLIANNDVVQYSQVYTGFVNSPAGDELTINIDNDVSVANFGLYDPSRSLTVTVRGASGNVITLSPATNGLSVVNDRDSLVYLGYGFNNPHPGPWRVTLLPTSRTPPLGTSYALVAQYVGGAAISSTLSSHLPGIGQQVLLTATLNLGNQPLALDSAQVVVTRPDGTTQNAPVTQNATSIVAAWQPDTVGVYGIDLHLRALLPDGTIAERSSYLALEAFEQAPEILK